MTHTSDHEWKQEWKVFTCGAGDMELTLNRISSTKEEGYMSWCIQHILPPTDYSTDFRIVCARWPMLDDNGLMAGEVAEPTETEASAQEIGEPIPVSPAE